MKDFYKDDLKFKATHPSHRKKIPTITIIGILFTFIIYILPTFKIHFSDYYFQIMFCRFNISDIELWKLQIQDCDMYIAICRLHYADCILQITLCI